MKKRKPIIWTDPAKADFRDIYESISFSAPMRAKRVRAKLKKLVKSLNLFPEKYSRVPELSDVDGNFRSVTKWNYKIIYEITDKYIIIQYIHHTSMDPDNIRKAIIN